MLADLDGDGEARTGNLPNPGQIDDGDDDLLAETTALLNISLQLIVTSLWKDLHSINFSLFSISKSTSVNRVLVHKTSVADIEHILC